MELMIVVAIIGILAVVALPSYRRYVLKSHRSSAITGVLDVASRQARYYTTNNTYTTSMTALGFATDPVALTDSSNHFYDLSVTGSTSSSFTVTAAPWGLQTSDTCGTFNYNDLGVKSITSGTLAECWKQ